MCGALACAAYVGWLALDGEQYKAATYIDVQIAGMNAHVLWASGGTVGRSEANASPCIVLLHDASEDLRHEKNYAMAIELAALIHDATDRKATVLTPRCPDLSTWDSQELAGLLTDFSARDTVNPLRVHLIGDGMGAFAAWDLAASSPEKFATVTTFGGFPTRPIDRMPPAWLSQTRLWHFDSTVDRRGLKQAISANHYSYAVWDQAFAQGDIVRTTRLDHSFLRSAKRKAAALQRSGALAWTMRSESRLAYKVAWDNGMPEEGSVCTGNIVRSGMDGDQVMGQVRVHLPKDYKWTIEKFENTLLLYIRDFESDSGLLADGTLAAYDGKSPSCIVVEMDVRLFTENGFSITSACDLLDRMFVVNPERIFGIARGVLTRLLWKQATEDPDIFAGLILEDYQPPLEFEHDAHRLYTLPKLFVRPSQRAAAAIKYMKNVASYVAPNGVLPSPASIEPSDSEVDLNQSILGWMAVQVNNRRNIERDAWPTNVPNLATMASPVTAARFERHLVDRVPLQKVGIDEYWLYSPCFSSVESPRLVLWLHGHGDAELKLHSGALKYIDYAFDGPSGQEIRKSFICAPQCPDGEAWYSWDGGSETERKADVLESVDRLVRELKSHHGIRSRDVHLVGISSGADAGWELLRRFGEDYGGAVLCGSRTNCKIHPDAFAGKRLWVCNSMWDPYGTKFPRSNAIAARNAGAEVVLTEIASTSHFCWAEALLDSTSLLWVLK
ncbi:hypothetical protein [Botrimarina mediterranea]|uniref:hypothetical protein n=1 Tax=Botrimarina mediterranea TaxID=2528022 RepID=UPI0011AA289E|nr:hypothetical protein [Botrimarina mediterranea]